MACSLCTSPAETYQYDATGALVRALGDDGKAAAFSLDAGMNISGASTANPLTGAPGGQILITATPVPLANPASTGITATVDLASFGGNATTALNDSGTNGDTVSGDGTFSRLVSIGPDTPLGTQMLTVTYTDSLGRTWQDFIPVSLSPGVPAMPLWAYAFLAVALLFLMRRQIARKAAACALVAILLNITSQAQSYPMWENVVSEMPESLAASSGETRDIRDGVPESGGAQNAPEFSALSLSVPESVDAEIAALATALGSGSAVAGEDATQKAVRIFNWVRNNIAYECYYGLRKGAALTLLEGSGNDFDQSTLLVDLLKAAGYPSSDIRLLLFSNSVDYESMKSWMGLADDPYPGQTFQQVYGASIQSVFGMTIPDKMAKQILWGITFLNGRGCGVASNQGRSQYDGSAVPGQARLIFDRLIVELKIGGNTFYLDPSYKLYASTAGVNLLSASGYARSTILSQAAGTADTNSASGLSASGIGTYLNGRATALSGYLSANLPGASLEALVSGRSIVRSDITSLYEAIVQGSFPANPTFAYFNAISDAGFASYKTTVRFRYSGTDGMDYTIPTSDLKGRKISLTFSGNTAELRLDDAAPESGSGRDASGTVTGATMDLSITVTHPGTRGTYSETKAYRKTTTAGDPCSYAIIYGFTASERLLAKRQEQLKSYKDAGKADSSREVRTELLNIMGLTWLYQSELSNRILASQNRVIPLSHHRFGRMAQEAGFYVDVALQLSGNEPDDGVFSDGRYDNVFHLGSLFWSAMEHGVIQQMQVKANGDPYDAVSTVDILRTANAAGGSQKLYLGRLSNWNTIKSSLTGYDVYNGVPDFGEFTDSNGNGAYDPGEPFTDQTIKQNLEWLINNREAQVFLPQSASVTKGIWTGTGWVIRSPGIAGMIISGGYSGGYATSVGTVTSPPITTSFSYNPTPIYRPPVMPVVAPYVPPAPTAPRNYGSDPVDMATGGFIYASEDMVTGIEGASRGLGFSRNYSSNIATRDEQNIGYGWSHSLHIRAEKRTAADAALGLGSAQQTVAFLAAVVAASDLYRKDATPKEWGTATLAVAWFVDRMKDNAVSIRIGKDLFQFIGQPDGTFTSPPGSTMTLTKAVDATYRLQQRLGNTIHFDTDGKAVKIEVDPGIRTSW